MMKQKICETPLDYNLPSAKLMRIHADTALLLLVSTYSLTFWLRQLFEGDIGFRPLLLAELLLINLVNLLWSAIWWREITPVLIPAELKLKSILFFAGADLLLMLVYIKLIADDGFVVTLRLCWIMMLIIYPRFLFTFLDTWEKYKRSAYAKVCLFVEYCSLTKIG